MVALQCFGCLWKLDAPLKDEAIHWVLIAATKFVKHALLSVYLKDVSNAHLDLQIKLVICQQDQKVLPFIY